MKVVNLYRRKKLFEGRNERVSSYLSGVESMHMIKKEQLDLRDQSVQNQKEFIHQLFGLAA
ncbi:hypothetical protein BCY92_12555 [Bacillus wiedmannii]|nr:hypothetical protein BCY92_12555 [Bacillus wiedmannii]